MKPVKYILCIVGLLLLFAHACRIEDDVTTDSSAKLQFSTDTLYFDTVFTKLDSTGIRPISITKQIRVINPNKNAVKTNIRLGGQQANVYRLNIDGESTNQKFGKEILGKDSIIIFVQCYIEPGNKNLPFIVADQLIFETNGNVQDIDLVAWGQDATYLFNTEVSCQNNNLRWTSEKPYVIYDSILVPKGCTLTIDAGTKIHSYNKSCILVAGTLVVNGTPENPVIFEGTRIDGEYKELTNQWIGIRLLPGSKDNVINSAIIRNGFVGLEVDSQPVSANPNLRLNQSRIYNMAAVGVVGYSSHIVATNNEITACGQFGFFGALGGNYKLYHNTIASYNVNFNRQNPLVVFDNSPYTDKDNNIVAKYELSIELVNNIIYGSLDEEFLINNNSAGIAPTPPIIQTNLIKTKQGALNVNGNILNQDPKFTNSSSNNYQLKAESVAKAKGTNIGINIDLKNNPRAAAPSLGCWE
ncbi:MAG: right-handed parallel beta-helix repeat-containing protein [Bacteroidetes bacterium]|nr:MAG: right-handed parallel beta-helix repeat-containing protein [Bacteroidota bacterium]